MDGRGGEGRAGDRRFEAAPQVYSRKKEKKKEKEKKGKKIVVLESGIVIVSVYEIFVE